MEPTPQQVMHIKRNFLDTNESKILFNDLLREIPWFSYTAANKISTPSYIYSKSEQTINKKQSIEKLISLIETNLETGVLKFGAWFYKNGECSISSKNIGLEQDRNVIHIILGSARKIRVGRQPYYLDDSNNANPMMVYDTCKLKNGDCLIVPDNYNISGTTYMTKKNRKITYPTIHIYAVIMKPYIYRYNIKCNVHVLGFGDTTILCDKTIYPHGIPDGTIITYMPNIFGESMRGIIDTIDPQLKNFTMWQS